ncbi:hypothetical protein ACWKTG_29350 [Bacillus thuringiensis]
MKAIALYLHRGILNTLEILCLGADRSIKKYKNDRWNRTYTYNQKRTMFDIIPSK